MLVPCGCPMARCLCSPSAGLQGMSWRLAGERSATEGAGGAVQFPGEHCGSSGGIGECRGGGECGGGCGLGLDREEAR